LAHLSAQPPEDLHAGIGRAPDAAADTDVAPFLARHVPCPHSIVTIHLIDEAGHPTLGARDEILSFFARRLTS
jgi:hypothetical protein